MKRFLRSLLSGFCFSIFGIGGLLTGTLFVPPVLIFCSKKAQKKILALTIHYLWKFFVGLMCCLKLIDIKTDNKQELKKLHGEIIIANHPSLIDVVILVSCIPRSICVVKDDLFKNFFIKSLIRRVYLSNTMAPDEFIQSASADLNSGYNIIIFPEGTRTIPGKSVHFHRGFAYLQIFSKHNIQPIHIENTPHILGKGAKWWDVGNKTSVYTLKMLQKINFNKNLKNNNRENAVLITETTKKSLFPAQTA